MFTIFFLFWLSGFSEVYPICIDLIQILGNCLLSFERVPSWLFSLCLRIILLGRMDFLLPSDFSSYSICFYSKGFFTGILNILSNIYALSLIELVSRTSRGFYGVFWYKIKPLFLSFSEDFSLPNEETESWFYTF